MLIGGIDNTMDDEKLDQLIINIYEIIPSYYDEQEASQIKELIRSYMSTH